MTSRDGALPTSAGVGGRRGGSGEPRRKGRGASVPAGTLRPVREGDVARDVLEQLRRAILTGRIVGGSRIREEEAAQQFGVSRAPLREALRQLESEGLIERFPRRGAIVVSVPERELETVVRVRAEIEALACATVAATINDEDVDELEVLLFRLERARGRKENERVISGDHAFHAAVLRMSGLVVLRQIWANIDGLARVRMYRVLDRLGSHSALTEGSPSHADILDALRVHDADLAAERARAHVLGPGRSMEQRGGGDEHG
jgi:DNA-binding GntR family transcriptional regulator